MEGFPMLFQPVTPLLYKVVERTTEQTTVLDVLGGSLAIVGALAAVAAVLGVAYAGLLIGIRRMRGQDKLTGSGRDSVQLRLDR